MKTGILLLSIVVITLIDFLYHVYRYMTEKDDINDFVTESILCGAIYIVLILLCI